MTIAAPLRADSSLSARVLDAMDAVPRAPFLDPHFSPYADKLISTPLGTTGQVTSDPRYIARMLSAAITDDTRKILEVGTGSGWQTAVLHHLAPCVYSIERHMGLFERASALLPDAALLLADGRAGWPDNAPFDAIVVCAGVKEPSELNALVHQLSPGGRIVAPVGRSGMQYLMLGSDTPGGVRWTVLTHCESVPMEHGLERGI